MSSGAAARVRSLVRQIEHDEGRDLVAEFSHLLTTTEEQFIVYARRRSRMTTIHRNGWPDFLLQENGKSFGVEVKANALDRLRPSQVAMFEALERTGLPVFVWSSDKRGTLTPWRRWPGAPEATRSLR